MISCLRFSVASARKMLCSRSDFPASSTNAFGALAPRRSPLPAASSTTATERWVIGLGFPRKPGLDLARHRLFLRRSF